MVATALPIRCTMCMREMRQKEEPAIAARYIMSIREMRPVAVAVTEKKLCIRMKAALRRPERVTPRFTIVTVIPAMQKEVITVPVRLILSIIPMTAEPFMIGMEMGMDVMDSQLTTVEDIVILPVEEKEVLRDIGLHVAWRTVR